MAGLLPGRSGSSNISNIAKQFTIRAGLQEVFNNPQEKLNKVKDIIGLQNSDPDDVTRIEKPQKALKYLGKEMCTEALDTLLKYDSEILTLERICSPNYVDYTNISGLIKIIYSRIEDSKLNNQKIQELVKLTYATRVLGLLIKDEFDNYLTNISLTYPSMPFKNLIEIYDLVKDNDFNLKDYNKLNDLIIKSKLSQFFGSDKEDITLEIFLGTLIKNILETRFKSIINTDIKELQRIRKAALLQQCLDVNRETNDKCDYLKPDNQSGTQGSTLEQRLRMSLNGGKRKSKKGSKPHKGGKKHSKKNSKRHSKNASKSNKNKKY